jgi:hypothetical protein
VAGRVGLPRKSFARGIVKATRIISGIGDHESRKLFKDIIRYLGDSKPLSEILIDGIGLTTIGGILNHVVGDRIPERTMPFKQHPDTGLDELWTAMQEFFASGQRRAIFMGIGGPYWDHWTIVHSISDKQIRFFDSHRLRRLNRSRCATTRSTASRPHLLCPTHTYFLS